MRLRLNRFVHWLGVAGIFAASALLFYFAIGERQTVALILAIATLLIGVLAVISGARGEPTGSLSGPSVGGKFVEVPEWATLGAMAILVVAIVLSFVFRGGVL